MTVYDRTAASRVIARLASGGLFEAVPLKPPGLIGYSAHRLKQGGTLAQRLYREKFMHPCPPEQITSATHRITWADSDGIWCTGHFVEGGLGPRVPIVARETVLALWRSLKIGEATPEEQAVLDGTTTDHDPAEIFRIGVEAAGRALAQHALLGHERPDLDARSFAAAMTGIFPLVLTHWYWELQASTVRRGMIPVHLKPGPGPLRYTSESFDILRRMKDATIADAHATMHRATTAEGFGTDEAVEHYHDKLDLISRQYALLPPGIRPRCLALPAVLPETAARFVAVFQCLLERVAVTETGQPPDEPDGTLFRVPDMNCRHCQVTIRGVLESMDLDVLEVDLIGKQVRVADFRRPRHRQRALDAVRDAGYTVLGGR